jgi:hypothetical protein
MAGRGKAARSRLLDEICVLCGYERKYASKLLGGRRPIAGEREAVSSSTGTWWITLVNAVSRSASPVRAYATVL